MEPYRPRTLIAWHGLARHGGDFSALARELGSGWRVLAPDTPGRGLSSWSLFPAHDYLYSHYVTVAIALLDHFKLDRVDWLGTSMGGLLGMLIAADPQHSQRISRLILNDIGPELNKQGLIGLSSYFGVTHRFLRLVNFSKNSPSTMLASVSLVSPLGANWRSTVPVGYQTGVGLITMIRVSASSLCTIHHATPGPIGRTFAAR
ncbi:hypothetical protein HSBAA_16530 [Vreelandella sulfidaeris]|uniref:AB hydrolase-1 domain-containing protein n=1 Tax=Vreelandella sulfidaeris TaxID=115553 RepID=A0A455U475_9GAMM|nr:hypothetical protein HSBAA_16530 [Halomonas sulfidaeris]